MGKITLLIILMIIVLVFPIYENSKIKLNNQKIIKHKIPIAKIVDANFSIYDKNLTKKGFFKILRIYKNLYIANDLNVSDLIKHEIYFAKKTIFKRKILIAYNFFYKNQKYFLKSNYVVYNLKTKDIYGNKFFLYSNDYNATGKNFFIDKNRDLKAVNISFNLKVNK